MPRFRSIAGTAGVVADFPCEGIQRREVGFGIGGRLDRVLGGQEIRRRLVALVNWLTT